MIPPAQNFCLSDVGTVPLRDVDTETVREMPDAFPASGDVAKAFVGLGTTLTFFMKSPKDRKEICLINGET